MAALADGIASNFLQVQEPLPLLLEKRAAIPSCEYERSMQMPHQMACAVSDCPAVIATSGIFVESRPLAVPLVLRLPWAPSRTSPAARLEQYARAMFL